MRVDPSGKVYVQIGASSQGQSHATTLAQICAQMNGWEVEAIPQLPILHHKPTGAGTYLLRHRFRLGMLDYSFGSHPAFELIKCMLRLPESPVFLGAALRWIGFCWCHLCREPRAVSPECVAYLRREQMGRLWSLFGTSKKPASKPAKHPGVSERFTSYQAIEPER